MLKEKYLEKWYQLLNWLKLKPRKWIKFIVLFICSIIVIFQLAECFWKLQHPPITTHSHFDLNETLSYPALTFCRDPPYKLDVLQKFNLAYHPKFTSHWRYFDFNNYTLADVFTEATYNPDEYFIFHALNGNTSYVKVQSSTHLKMGQCQTVLPLVTTKNSLKESGYSIILKHSMKEMEESNASESDPPGWHLYIHEPHEIFTENRMQSSGRVEYLYVEVGEQIEIKLTVQNFAMMQNNDNSCSNQEKMSLTKCGEVCHWKHIVAACKCKGPWMEDVEAPMCNTFYSTRELIRNVYLLEVEDKVCGCIKPCYSIIYSAFIQNRKSYNNQTVHSSHLYLYYTSRMVTIIEERPGYDLSQFVSDMGGSLGFLLGLSVLGLIGILEEIFKLIFLRQTFLKKNDKTPLEIRDEIEKEAISKEDANSGDKEIVKSNNESRANK